MRKTIPRVVYSPLGRCFYVVLRYTLKETKNRRVVLIAHEKYDVTADVRTALRDERRHRAHTALRGERRRRLRRIR